MNRENNVCKHSSTHVQTKVHPTHTHTHTHTHTGSNNTGHMMTNDTSNNELRNVAIITVVVSIVAMTTIISLTIAVFCCVYYRKRKQKLERRRNASDEIAQSDFRTSTSSYGAPDLCQAFLPQSTLSAS